MKLHPVFSAENRLLQTPPKAACRLSGTALGDVRNMENLVVYLWLGSRVGRWVYIRSVRDGVLDGFVLQGGRWTMRKISLRQIRAFY